MMESRVGKAKELHKGGFNCCQAVVCSYCDLLGMDVETGFRAGEAYGLGIAKRYETCGSVCGMMMLPARAALSAFRIQPKHLPDTCRQRVRLLPHRLLPLSAAVLPLSGSHRQHKHRCVRSYSPLKPV